MSANGAWPATGAENRGGILKKASDILAQVKAKSDRGFRKSIDDAVAVIDTERRVRRERERAEKNRLEAGRQKAVMVRELMVLPLLNDLAADFATDDKQVLPSWQVQSGGDADVAHGIASTPALDDGGPSSFLIKAAAAVIEQGAGLTLSVECSCVDAQNLATGKVRQLCEKTKAAAMMKFDDLGNQLWFHEQLKECVRLCVLTRLRHVHQSDARPAVEPASSPKTVCEKAASDPLSAIRPETQACPAAFAAQPG